MVSAVMRLEKCICLITIAIRLRRCGGDRERPDIEERRERACYVHPPLSSCSSPSHSIYCVHVMGDGGGVGDGDEPAGRMSNDDREADDDNCGKNNDDDDDEDDDNDEDDDVREDVSDRDDDDADDNSD